MMNIRENIYLLYYKAQLVSVVGLQVRFLLPLTLCSVSLMEKTHGYGPCYVGSNPTRSTKFDKNQKFCYNLYES